MFLKAFQHFTGETHWFPSSSEGVKVPDELVPFVKLHIQQYGWSESIVELKDTGNYATSKGYERLGKFIENHQNFVSQIQYAEEYGASVFPEGYGEHYTLCGVRVAEPRGNWGKDYWDNNDAENAFCILLKPSVFGLSGYDQETVARMLLA